MYKCRDGNAVEILWSHTSAMWWDTPLSTVSVVPSLNRGLGMDICSRFLFEIIPPHKFHKLWIESCGNWKITGREISFKTWLKIKTSAIFQKKIYFTKLHLKLRLKVLKEKKKIQPFFKWIINKYFIQNIFFQFFSNY